MNPILSGQTFGKYHILREIGRGGMGVVYLAEDTTLGRSVALKTLYPALAMDTEFIERFRAEARHVAALTHPGVVRIHSFEEIEGRATIDMEYIDGEPLSSLMLREVMTPHLVVSLMQPVVEALAECHAEGIVHRDVKPGNILVGKNGRVVLTDFGLAKAYAHHLESMVHGTSSSGFFLGTPRYAPPEAWDSGVASPAWDVYSIGMVMYEALSGRLAYSGSTPLEIMRQMVSEPPRPVRELVPAVSEELAELIDGLLDRDPAHRPVDAGEVLGRLRDVPEFDTRGITSSVTVIVPRRAPGKWRSTVRRLAQPRRLAKAAAAVSVVLACAAIAALYVAGAGSQPGVLVPVVSQESLGRSRLVPAGQMLSLPRSAQTAACSFFDVSFLEKDSGLDGLWMMLPGQPPEADTVLGLTATGFCRLALVNGENDEFHVSGDWAGYAQPSGLYCREAAVKGTGRWVPRGEAMSFQLELTDISDNTVRRMAAMATRSTRATRDTQFLCAMEESPLAMPLLYLELLPKHREWARQCEAMLPAVAGARLEVPCLGVDPGLVVDGRLDEAVWQGPYYSERGRMGLGLGRPETTGARMAAVATPKGLYFGFLLPGKADAPLGLEFGVMPRLAIPAETSARALAVWRPGAPPETRLMVGDRETPWTCDWQCAFAPGAGGRTVEVFIPAGSLRDAALPRPGNTWRVNATLAVWDTPAEARPVAQWGWPDFERVLHGMVVHFVNTEPQP